MKRLQVPRSPVLQFVRVPVRDSAHERPRADKADDGGSTRPGQILRVTIVASAARWRGCAAQKTPVGYIGLLTELRICDPPFGRALVLAPPRSRRRHQDGQRWTWDGYEQSWSAVNLPNHGSRRLGHAALLARLSKTRLCHPIVTPFQQRLRSASLNVSRWGPMPYPVLLESTKINANV